MANTLNSNQVRSEKTIERSSIFSRLTSQLSMDMPLLKKFNFPVSLDDIDTLEKLCGMHTITDSRNLCEFKKKPEDFIVQEVLPNNEIVPLKPSKFYSLPGENGGSSILHGVMVKKNMESLRLVKTIKEEYEDDSLKVYISGIKDKRAITSQRVAFTGVPEETLKKYLQNLEQKLQNVHFYAIEPRETKISTGIHKGNYFTVILRSVSTNNCDTRFNIRELSHYFSQQLDEIPNYFGPQRFGGRSKNSHLVGWYLIKRRPVEAMKMYLGFPTVEEPIHIMQEKSEILEQLNDDTFDSDYFEHLGFELGIAKYIQKNTDDPWKTLYLFPRTTIKVMIQSVASYIFNCYLKRRMEIEPSLNQPIEGEIIRDDVILAPVIGYGMAEEIDFETTSGKIIQDLMNQLELDYNDFDLNDVHHLWYGFQGYWRPVKISPSNFSIEPHFEGIFSIIKKVYSKFNSPEKIDAVKIMTQLNKGQYLTTFLRDRFIFANEYIR